MRHYSCDVCGLEMPPGYERSTKKPDGPGGICRLEDVCPRCIRVGKDLPVREVLLEHWRKLVEEDTGTDPEPEVLREKNIKSARKGALDKSQILDRLYAFRGDPPRLGCWNELSAATKGKVTPDQLRDITINGVMPSADVWKLIEKGLDKLEAAHEQNT